jgi:hypothetical protein
MLARSIASITTDLDDAQRLAQRLSAADGAALAEAVRDARTALAAGIGARESGGDPLSALCGLARAEATLDRALAPVRDKAEVAARAAALVRDTLTRVGSALRSMDDLVATRPGEIPADLHTRLAEAAELAERARERTASDPVGALAAAQEAERLTELT